MAALNMEEEEPLFTNGSHVLPWDRFRRWITCFCVVTFDIEVGQAMEMIYPNHIELSDKEKTNICYLAFPDSNSGCMGDTEFHFRIRCCPQMSGKRWTCRKKESALPLGYRELQVIEYRLFLTEPGQKDYAHYYGFVYFRQVKDPSVQRGYFQKSLVLLSRLPYVNLFSEVVRTIAPEFFENGLPSLEAVCNNIDQWPEPEAGHTIQLPMMGNVLQVRVPSRNDKPGAVSSPDGPMNINLMTPIPSPKVIPTLKEPDTFRFLQPVLGHIHLLWELILTNEPIVVMAPTPNMCSNTVQVLVNMILPLHYCSDYRPFFTIHDSEFKEYTTRTQAPPNIILGVTNPFFAKTLQHWPHVVRIGEMSNLVISSRKSPAIGQAAKRNLSSKPGIYTKYKMMLNRDKMILRKLSKGNHHKRPPEVQNAILRRHMVELTQSFMIPLERYVASLMPLQKSISPWKRPPRIKNFDIEEFLKTLSHFGPQLTSKHKGNWILLYRLFILMIYESVVHSAFCLGHRLLTDGPFKLKKFFKSPNFEGWLRHRQQEILQKLKVLHLEALGNADVSSWIEQKSEVEVVDLYLRIKENLVNINSYYPPVSERTKNQLRQHLKTITETLPTDLKFVLTNS